MKEVGILGDKKRTPSTSSDEVGLIHLMKSFKSFLSMLIQKIFEQNKRVFIDHLVFDSN